MPFATKTMRSWKADDLLRDLHSDARGSQDGGHFHQLFHNLWNEIHRAQRDNILRGHLDVQILEEIHQLFHLQRHRSVEDLHVRRVLDPLLHGVPLYPPLRPPLDERCRPCGGRSHQALGVVQLVSLLPPGPGCLLAPWGGMVRHFSQGHGDGHPLMSKKRAEPALPPPPCGARNKGAFSTRAIGWVLNHHSHTNKETRAGVIRLCGVCGARDLENGVSVQARFYISSRRPRHPFPALMAGVSPGRVPVHTALKRSTMSSP